MLYMHTTLAYSSYKHGAGSGQFYSREKKSIQKTNKNKRNFDMVLFEFSSRIFATNNTEQQEVTEDVHVVCKLECCFVLTERSIMTPIQLYNHKKPDPLIHTTNSDM